MPKSKKPKPGYRAPRSNAEREFWELYRPDYLAWATKRKLTLDQVAALAMGLDPACLDVIHRESGQTFARFKATKAWFQNVERRFEGYIPKELLGVSVFAMDYYLPIPDALSEAADLDGRGLLAREELVIRLERKIKRLREIVDRQNAVIAKSAIDRERVPRPKFSRPSDVTNTEKTSAKLVLALLREIIGAGWDEQLNRFKAGRYTKFVGTAKSAADRMGWNIDEATIKTRVDAAMEELPPNSDISRE